MHVLRSERPFSFFRPRGGGNQYMINWLDSWGGKVSWILYIVGEISFLASRLFFLLKRGGCMCRHFSGSLGAVCYGASMCHD